MKKLLVLMLLFLCLFSLALAEDDSLAKVLEKGVLTVAISPDYAPYEYIRADDTLAGSDIKFAEYIAKDLGVELQFDRMNFQACLAAVQTGASDVVISSLGWKEERAEIMNLSDLYNDNMIFTVLVRKEDADTLTTAESFTGKVIACQNGATTESMTRESLDCTVELIKSAGDGVMALLSGKVDGVSLSVGVAESLAAQNDKLAVSSYIFDYVGKGNVVATMKGNDTLTTRINEIIRTCKEQGLFEVWMQEAQEESAAEGV